MYLKVVLGNAGTKEPDLFSSRGGNKLPYAKAPGKVQDDQAIFDNVLASMYTCSAGCVEANDGGDRRTTHGLGNRCSVPDESYMWKLDKAGKVQEDRICESNLTAPPPHKPAHRCTGVAADVYVETGCGGRLFQLVPRRVERKVNDANSFGGFGIRRGRQRRRDRKKSFKSTGNALARARAAI